MSKSGDSDYSSIISSTTLPFTDSGQKTFLVKIENSVYNLHSDGWDNDDDPDTILMNDGEYTKKVKINKYERYFCKIKI